jgi:excisionase family DNA binding protein
VNLKQAAGRLGVHYQTAYKWVRSGTLSAVRVGGRYEVSEAAIEQFTARRAASREDLLNVVPEPAPCDLSREDALEEFEAMATDHYLSARSSAKFAARRTAELIGDLSIVTCFDRKGQPQVMVADHPNPAHGALIQALLDVYGPASMTPGFAFSTFSEQQVIRLSHVPQDLFRDQMRPEIRQHLTLNPVRCLLSVPFKSCDGTVLGVITLTRSQGTRPFSDEDESFARQIALRLGALVESARDVELAVAIRRDLVTALRASVTDHAPLSPGPGLDRLLSECGADSYLPVTVLDDQRRFLAVNDAFRNLREHGSTEFTGKAFESMTHPDDQATERATFDRLVSGELDYLDLHLRRVILPGPREIVYTSHRAAVRAPDASLRYLVTVVRPLKLTPGDYPAVGETVLRSIDAPSPN